MPAKLKLKPKTKHLIGYVVVLVVPLVIMYYVMAIGGSVSLFYSILNRSIPSTLNSENVHVLRTLSSDKIVETLKSPQFSYAQWIEDYEVFVIFSDNNSNFRLAYKRVKINGWKDRVFLPEYFISRPQKINWHRDPPVRGN